MTAPSQRRVFLMTVAVSSGALGMLAHAQAKPTDKAAGCPLFAGKQVAGPGWCGAWAKKA